MNDDELFRRLRGADPARRDTAAESWLDDLVEETMGSPENPTQNPSKRRWVRLAAAAAVLAIAAGGAGFLLSDGADDPAPRSNPTATELTDAGAGPAKCAPMTPDLLKLSELAFDGTASEVSDQVVVLEVGRWYKGGGTDLVVVAPAPELRGLLLTVDFQEGERYLVTATDGRVGVCGSSAAYSADLAAMYDEAFPG